VYKKGDRIPALSATVPKSSSMYSNSSAGSEYIVEDLVGHGAFAELYNVYCQRTKQNYAVKVEKARQDGTSKLEKEALIQKQLHKALNCPAESFVPRFYGYQKTALGPYMVLDLLGRDLSKVRKSVKRHKLSICSVGYLGEQLIRILEKVHSEGIVHRDIKPQNCMLGNTQSTKLRLHLVDFGLAREDFFEEKVQCEPAKGVSFRGTAAYASLNSLQNVEQSKRDDIEGAFWVFADLLWGGLPWRRLNVGRGKERDKKIVAGKKLVFEALEDADKHRLALRLKPTPDGVYSGPLDEKGYFCPTPDKNGAALLESLPEGMISFLRKLRTLEFNERPDYDFFANCFETLKRTGDSRAFRDMFFASSRDEAISREVHGSLHEAAFFNRPTHMTYQSTMATGSSTASSTAAAAKMKSSGYFLNAHLHRNYAEHTPQLHATAGGNRKRPRGADDSLEILFSEAKNAKASAARTAARSEDLLESIERDDAARRDHHAQRRGGGDHRHEEEGEGQPRAAKRQMLLRQGTATSGPGGSSCSSGGPMSSMAVESVRPNSSCDGGGAGGATSSTAAFGVMSGGKNRNGAGGGLGTSSNVFAPPERGSTLRGGRGNYPTFGSIVTGVGTSNSGAGVGADRVTNHDATSSARRNKTPSTPPPGGGAAAQPRSGAASKNPQTRTHAQRGTSAAQAAKKAASSRVDSKNSTHETRHGNIKGMQKPLPDVLLPTTQKCVPGVVPSHQKTAATQNGGTAATGGRNNQAANTGKSRGGVSARAAGERNAQSSRSSAAVGSRAGSRGSKGPALAPPRESPRGRERTGTSRKTSR